MDHEAEPTMADEFRIARDELLRRAELDRDRDFLRERLRMMPQALMGLEVPITSLPWRTSEP